VSLVPSVTETLLAWDVVPVAVTRFCEQPHLLAVGGTKNPDVGAIVRLEPDLVVLDEEENRKEDADALVTAGLALHVTRVRALDDVAPTLAALATAVGVAPTTPPTAPAAVHAPRAGSPAVDAPTSVQGAVRNHRIGTDSVPHGSGTGTRSAFVPIWRRPWMTVNGDTYGSSLLAAIGIANVYADAPERYPTVTLEEAAAHRPALVVAPDEPYRFRQRDLAELRHVAADARIVDGQDLFWWGVRTPAALARLGQALAPPS
jgi:ABC-type Fe3+-hydroxamate transport system substrate-binding protein